MINKKLLLTAVSNFIPGVDAQKISSAFDKAKNIMDMASNPMDALEKAGITTDKINEAKDLLNNPLTSTALSFIGVNKKNAVDVLNKIGSTDMKVDLSAKTSTDKLSDLQKNLARLKK